MDNTNISDDVQQTSSHHHHSHSHSHSSSRDSRSPRDTFSHIVISLVLIVITLLLTLNYSLFSNEMIIKSFDSAVYTEGAYNDIVLKVKTIAAKNGIPYKTIENIITQQNVDTDVTQYINSLNAKEPSVASDNIKTETLVSEAYENILTYATKNGATLTEEKTSKIQSIAKSIGDEYKSAIAMKNFEKFLSFSTYFDVVKSILIPVCVILFVAVSYVWIKDNLDQRHRLLRKYGGVCGTTGFAVSEISLVFFAIGIFKKLSFTTTLREYMAFTSYFRTACKSVLIVGLVWIAIEVGLIVLWKTTVDKSGSKI